MNRQEAQIDHERQNPVEVVSQSLPVDEGRPDDRVAGRLIAEWKAVDVLAAIHEAQVMSYWKASRLRPGLLIKFHVPTLKHGLQRVILS